MDRESSEFFESLKDISFTRLEKDILVESRGGGASRLLHDLGLSVYSDS